MTEVASLLASYPDDRLIALLGLTRVQVYKLRKGTDGLDAKQIQRLREFLPDEAAVAADPNNPDYSHPGFARYEEMFADDVAKKGFESTYIQWSAGFACGCMGPQNGDPFCHCQMMGLTASRHGKVVRREV